VQCSNDIKCPRAAETKTERKKERRKKRKVEKKEEPKMEEENGNLLALFAMLRMEVT
jgi:ribosomal protein L12E/L44/L45/RPP1/RPP2